MQGAKKLIDVSKAHIDGCAYNGEASILFPREMARDGSQVSIPTTMNAISIDKRRYNTAGIDADFEEKGNQVTLEHEKMGVQPTYACTPYLLPGAPEFGEHIAWAESNAVVFANSVIGARSNRYGDFMDLCIALTGRAPLSGYHLDEERLGTIHIRLNDIEQIDSFFYPILGYLIGHRAGKGVPVIEGLNHEPDHDDLKAFGAALATSGAVGMFHIVGVTPEAPTVEAAFGNRKPSEVWHITKEELTETWQKLKPADNDRLDLILMGSPQLSLDEFKQINEFVMDKEIHPDVKLILTTNRYAYDAAEKMGYIDEIKRFGAEIITDSCLCMIRPFIESYVQKNSCKIMTNSGKFVHYGPALLNKDDVSISSTMDCLRSAVLGYTSVSAPDWLK